MSPVPGVPIADFDLRAPGLAANPYPAFERLRAQGPITWHEGLNRFLITGWKESASLLLDARRFGSAEQGFIDLFGGRTMECMDRPRHGEVRGIWARDFDPCPIGELTAMVRAIIKARLDPFVERVMDGETVDAVSTFTRGIPTLVIADMLGIDPADFQLFSDWSDAMGDQAEGLGDPSPRGKAIVQKARAATLALNDYIRARLDDRRKRPGIDLISKMMASPVSRDLEESEIVASNTQLVFAGNETTAKLMAITLEALAKHPDQRAAIAADRSLIAPALEEIHRWNTIVNMNGRYVRGGGATLGGYDLPDGVHITTIAGAVNRDPARWGDPSRLDVRREARNHMGFGFGMHVCLGMHLARLESQIWLDMLLDALPAWELGEVDWGTNWAVRGPIRVEIRRAH